MTAGTIFHRQVKVLMAFLVIMLYCNSAFSQPFGEPAPGFRVIRMDYDNSDGEKAGTWFRYNYDGVLIKSFWAREDKKRSSVNYYSYDSRGQVISAFRVYSDSLTSNELFFYDNSGNKISENFFGPKNSSGYSTYTYRNNMLEKAELVKHKGWLNGTISYQYDSSNRKVKGVMTKSGRTVCEIEFRYASDGNLIEEEWNFMGEWSQKFIYFYEKCDKHKNYYTSPLLSNNGSYRIKQEQYSYNDEFGGPSYYYYDGNGRLERKTFRRYDGVSTSTSYTYDGQGKLVNSFREYSSGKKDTISYIYDSHNNLVLRICKKSGSIGWYESFNYNSSGELTGAVFKNSDNWLSGTISFKCNEKGFISEGSFIGEDGVDASIIFEYNEYDLISGITWKFTNGKFQKYNFEYE